MSPTLRLGVTGLARSGKTVFITSLIHNLLDRGQLPFFDPLRQGRILSVYIEPQPDDSVPRFEYEDHAALLTSPDPQWPQSTRSISQIRLTIEYEPIGAFWNAFGTNRLHLDIEDYPGEWLLDLPLLDASFQEWSRSSIASAREPQRGAASREWRGFLSQLDPAAKQNETLAREGAAVFTRYLQACKQETLALSALSPGRFLLPSDLAGSPAVTFFPLDLPAADREAPRDSLRAMMERRFEAYKTHVALPFFRNHFARLDRQIVLVDLLSALNAGPYAVADLRRALDEVLTCFRYGENRWYSFLTGKSIDRLAFAATKADHLHHENHIRLEAILTSLMNDSLARTAFQGADVKAFAMASLRSTREALVKQNGDSLGCVAGIPIAGETVDGQVFDGKRELAIYPGDLPDDPARVLAPDWIGTGNPLHFVRFRPPLAPAPQFGKPAPLPHIGLDRVLNFVLADKLS
jgi:predicted YcjX-like family ATPase